MVGRIYIEDHYTLLQTKYKSSGPCGLGEEDFFIFYQWHPQAWPVCTPGARLARFIKRTFIHCYIQNRKDLGLVISEKKTFFKFFPLKAIGANDPAVGPFSTPGAWLAGFIKRTTIHCYT